MEAIDLDKRGTQNSHVRYEIIKVRQQCEASSSPEKSPIKGSLIIFFRETTRTSSQSTRRVARSLWWSRWSSATEELVDQWWRSSRSSHCRWPRGYYSACAAYVFYEDWIEKNIALKEQNCSWSLSRKNKVRAYDLGIPSLDSEVPVNIFTQDVQKRWSLLFFFLTVTMCFQLRVVRLILPEAASTLSQVMLSQNQHQSPSSLWFMILITKYSF